MIGANLVARIEEIAGKENVYLDKETRVCYSYDATNIKYLPEVIVFLNSATQISEIMKLANEHRFPVIPRGAGTGFTGGSLPVEGGGDPGPHQNEQDPPDRHGKPDCHR